LLAAYGQILRKAVLDVPPLGILNIHASLLPRWRGAAPVAAAILAGDAETGATIMRVVRALGAGPMLGRVALPVAPDDTTGTLTERIAEAGAALLIEVLPAYAAGELAPEEQDDALATYAPQVEAADARIDWRAMDAAHIARMVRAYNPWPGAYTEVGAAHLRILEATADVAAPAPAPGTVAPAPRGSGCGFIVGTAAGALGVITAQASGGRAMPATDYVRGHPGLLGARLGQGPGDVA
jgi:methionyl-tRNA formyltransferase